MLFDFHSHILPHIDDGSQSIEESCALLKESYRQGVKQMAATPHFYAHQLSPQKFLERRNHAWERLQLHLTAEMPEIVLGGEIHYYEGMSRTQEIDQLCLGDTRILLVEMPESRWSKHMLESLLELQNRRITVMIAHIERYIQYQPAGTWEFLLNHGILIQASAALFLPFSTRRKAVRQLRDGMIHAIGSDCHNMESRRPNMGPAVEYIQKKLGSHFIADMEEREERLLNGSETIFQIPGGRLYVPDRTVERVQ